MKKYTDREYTDKKNNFKNMNYNERRDFCINEILYFEKIGFLSYDRFINLTTFNNYIDGSDVFSLLNLDTQKMIMQTYEKHDSFY